MDKPWLLSLPVNELNSIFVAVQLGRPRMLLRQARSTNIILSELAEEHSARRWPVCPHQNELEFYEIYIQSGLESVSERAPSNVSMWIDLSILGLQWIAVSGRVKIFFNIANQTVQLTRIEMFFSNFADWNCVYPSYFPTTEACVKLDMKGFVLKFCVQYFLFDGVQNLSFKTIFVDVFVMKAALRFIFVKWMFMCEPSWYGTPNAAMRLSPCSFRVSLLADEAPNSLNGLDALDAELNLRALAKAPISECATRPSIFFIQNAKHDLTEYLKASKPIWMWIYFSFYYNNWCTLFE